MLRQLMIDRMVEEIGDPNGSSRYGRLFCRLRHADPMTKREIRFNNTMIQSKERINVDLLDQLTDEQLFHAYNTFMRRYCTWM
jgi:hypothetical protein